MSSNDKKCCLCGCDYDEFGNNPFPLANEGKCCDTCNQEVIKARLKAIFKEHEESNIVSDKSKDDKGSDMGDKDDKGKGKATDKSKSKGKATDKSEGKSKTTDSD